jgi:prolyl-tRNA editing enzyme YbaK/EbsC (Cys-tRNA(Pro) deacylase)
LPNRDPKDRLKNCGFPFELLENRRKIRSSAEGAAYWGIDIGSTAPALVLRAGEAFLLLIVSGAVRKVDFEALARETGSSGLRLAAPNEIKERFGLKPGEVPLFGLEIPTMVDRRLMAYDFVYGGSGDPGFTLKIAPGALLVLNGNSCLGDVPCLVEESGKGGI